MRVGMVEIPLRQVLVLPFGARLVRSHLKDSNDSVVQHVVEYPLLADVPNFAKMPTLAPYRFVESHAP